MLKLGDIVCFDDIRFKDGTKDQKVNRPCMVICTYTTLTQDELLFCMPFTSQIKSFNKKPQNYLIVPEIIYNAKKLSFIKIDNLFVKNISDEKDTGLSVNLPKENIDNLRKKISRFAQKEEKYYSLIEKILNYQDKILEKQNKEENKSKKLERKLKREQAKLNNM